MGENSKVCTRCKKDLPSTFFRSRNDDNCVYLESKCRNCEKEVAVEYRSKPGYYDKRRKYKASKARDIKFHVQEKISQWRGKTAGSDLDSQYLIDLFNSQSGLCFYTSRPMVLGARKGVAQPDSLSLDRLVPEKGYTKGNVVWCCYLVNTMKQNLSEEEFYLYIKNILHVRGK